MDRKLDPRSASVGALTVARSGIGALSRVFLERPLLCLSLGLAAAAGLVARFNARRFAPRAPMAASDSVASRGRMTDGRRRTRKERARKAARRTKTPSRAA